MVEQDLTMTSKPSSPGAFWHQRLFGIVASVCALFIVLTTTAMFLYPGGAVPIAATHGYQFFVNFFSDLGQTRTQSGAYNYPSMLLFTSAMIAIGGGMGAFFVGFAKFFHSRSTTPWGRRLNLAATAVGVVAAICFAGAGSTPYNLFFFQHQAFVQWAFRLLLLAVILEVAAMRLTRDIPAPLLWVNVGFVVVLFGYLMLMMFGPSTGTLTGDEIHAVGQKFIVYTAITTVFTQALLLRSHLNRPREAYSEA